MHKDIEQYTFDDIMQYEQWARLNSETLDGIVQAYKVVRDGTMGELLLGEVVSRLEAFEQDLSDTIDRHNNKQKTQDLVRRVRTLRTLKDECICYNTSKSEIDELDLSEQNMLELWEYEDKQYCRQELMHCYYIAGFMMKVLHDYEEYEKDVIKIKHAKKEIPSFYEWYLKNR